MDSTNTTFQSITITESTKVEKAMPYVSDIDVNTVRVTSVSIDEKVVYSEQ